MFSGGIGSWGAARRLVDTGDTLPSDITLLFSDTLIEDEDLYRFLDEAAEDIGAELIRLTDGRTPWDVFRDVRFIGDHRAAPCSKELKQNTAKAWVRQNHPDPATVTLHLGIDWTEIHRMRGAEKGWAPYAVTAPLCDRPYLTKHELLTQLKARGIEPPRLYTLGFPHNNCGGFCVRAGRAQFAHLLDVFPERYAFHEKEEEKTRQLLGRGSILQEKDGTALTLRTFRRYQEAKHGYDEDDWGGCGCFVDD